MSLWNSKSSGKIACVIGAFLLFSKTFSTTNNLVNNASNKNEIVDTVGAKNSAHENTSPKVAHLDLLYKINCEVNDVANSVDVVDHKVDTIDSKIDALVVSSDTACCTTVSSKVDIANVELLAIESKLDTWVGPLVEGIDSKIDNLDLGGNTTCETVSSKVDIANIELVSIESKLDFHVIPTAENNNSKLAVLDSKVDLVEEKVDMCCQTVSSKLDIANTELVSIESKLDQVVIPLLEEINDKVDLCVIADAGSCQEVDRQLEKTVIPGLHTIESKIDYDIGPMKETISSLLDVIDGKVLPNPCFETIASKIDAVIIPKLAEIEFEIDTLQTILLSSGDALSNGNNLITQDGLYTLSVNTAGCVIIDADDVILDLCGFTLSCDSAAAVIEILPGHTDIEIINGKIEGAGNFDEDGIVTGFTNDGILTGSACRQINIEDIEIYNCEYGLHCDGTETDDIRSCRIENCIIYNCLIGTWLDYVIKTRFRDTQCFNCKKVGFDQTYCQFNLYDDCKSLDTSNGLLNERAIGFRSYAGLGNLYRECVAEGTSKAVDSQFGYGAIGFLLTGAEGAMEAETKIINSVANSTSVLSTGSADAYGIFIEPYLKSGSDMTDFIVSETKFVGTGVRGIEFSKDSRYFVVGGNATAIEVHRVNDDGSMTLIDTYPIAALSFFGYKPFSWRPDSMFLASGSTLGNVYIFNFNGSKLTLADTLAFGSAARAVDWTSDGNYLAVGGVEASGDSLQVYSFSSTGTSGSLSAAPVALVSSHPSVNAVRWTQTGKYLAVVSPSDAGNELFIYSFDGANLLLKDSKDVGGGLDVDWSPDGRYLALACDGTVVSELEIYDFDGEVLTPLCSIDTDNPDAYSVRWSPDGKYLVMSTANYLTDYEIVIYHFDGATLTPQSSYEWANNVAVDWSPNGKYIVAGGLIVTDFNIRLFEVMDCPTGCLIDSNRICNASGDDGFHGVGLSGSGQNLYINNIASSNDTNYNDTIQPRFGNLFGPAYAGTSNIVDNLSV